MKKQILFAIILLTIFIITSACSRQTPSPMGTLQTPPTPVTSTQAMTQPTPPPASTEAIFPTITDTESTSASVSFANDIMPILEARCIKCHGVESKKEGLDLQTYDNIFAGSRNGSVIEPGNATDSLLVQLIVKGKMPNRGPKVTPEELQLIRDWIDQGARNN